MDSASEKSLFQGLLIFEIITNILGYFFGGLCFYIFLKTPLFQTFHTNFIRLLKCLIFYYIFAQILRLIAAINELLDDEAVEFDDIRDNYIFINGKGAFKILGTIRFFSLSAALIATGTIGFERTSATLQLKTYETTVSTPLFIACFVCQIFFAGLETAAVYTEKIDPMFAGVAVITVNLFGCIYLIALESFNKKRYLTSLTTPTMYCLSERFQLQENVKSAKMIKRVAMLMFGLNLFLGTFTAFSLYYNTSRLRRLAYMILQICLSFYGYSFAITGISMDSNWRQHFKKLFARSKKVSVAAASPSLQPKKISQPQLLNHNGKQMIFNTNEETDLYFKQLQNDWR